MDKMVMGLDEAIRADADAFYGTRAELSRRVCGSAQALQHKLAGFKGQFLRPDELVDLQLHSGSRAVVSTMAAMLGGVYLQLPPIDVEIGGEELEQQLMLVTVRLGELFAEMTAAQADGVIDGMERAALDRRFRALREAIGTWLCLAYRLYRPPLVAGRIEPADGGAADFAARA